jgi:hypothetical protein
MKLMKQTPIDLYRFGQSPRLDRVRADPQPLTKSKDAVSFFPDQSTEQWVRGRISGVSCFIRPNNGLRGRGKWWLLPANTEYDDNIIWLYTLDQIHWYWAPDHDMRFTDFEQALAKLNTYFR